MKDRKILNALKPCLPFYLLALLLILGMKYGYGKADSEELLWILAPTCWWVRFLSGIPFQWIPDVGYVSQILFRRTVYDGFHCRLSFFLPPSEKNLRAGWAVDA